MNRFIILGCLLVASLVYGATTYTTNYQFGKPGDGDSNYGETIRDNWDAADTQIKANADATTNHIADSVGAHAATAISTTAGSFLCTTQTTVQAFLACLDGTFDPSTSGVVLIAGTQTLTGVKTFGASPVFSAASDGVVKLTSGVMSAVDVVDELPVTTKGDILIYDNAGVDRFPIGSDDQILVADSSVDAGMKWETKNPRWRKFTYDHSDFSTGATTFSITAFSLAAGEGIDSVIVRHTTAFSGGSISAYTIQVGVSADLDNFASPFNVFQAAGGTVSSVGNFIDVPNFASTTDFVVTADSVGDDLDQASAGSVDIYVRTFLLP